MSKAATWLKETLDFEFNDGSYLVQALTHRSSPGANNERLEFLGDAVLDTVVSEVIYRYLPGGTEGELSRLRSSLVKDSALAELAADIGIGEFLIMGPGEKKTGGHRRASILADAIEALFGAVYLDSGYEAAARVIHRAYGDKLEDLPDPSDLRDPKTRLQEHLQSQKLGLPAYEIRQVTGKAHKQCFVVSCTVAEMGLSTEGEGSSRRSAEQRAARAMEKALLAVTT